MDSPPSALTILLAELAASGAEFVLVGALAAVAQGAPLMTQDIDIVHRRTEENVDVLLSFLSSLRGHYRGRTGPAMSPARAALLGTGRHLLMTDLGPLDVLGAIEGGRAFDDLMPHAVKIEVAGRNVQVLSLETLLELKRHATSNKAKMTFAILQETLRRMGRHE